jgi:hypothetical protein
VTPASDRTTSLLLAAIDMEQTIQAAKMLLEEIEKPDFPNKHQRLRALETAIAVTYARSLADSKGSFVVPQSERPPASSQLRELHDHLLHIRHKAYAHIDRTESARTAGIDDRGFVESWVPWIVGADVPMIVVLSEHQRDRFRALATAL